MKKYGIRVTLPEGDPMQATHLLGENWEAMRWYDTEDGRDCTLQDMLQKHPYYRVGDVASVVLAKVERDE